MLSINNESGVIERIAERLALVRKTIAQSAAKANRRTEDVVIVTVSKRQPESLIRAAYACGLRCFGENYAEEALIKIQNLSDLRDLRWDMVGQIQSRKAKLIVNQVACVQSLDSLKLAGILSRLRAPDLPPLEVLLEVNVSGEASKAGFWAVSPDTDWPNLLPVVDEISRLPRLCPRGLMTMPPLQDDMEENRKYFRKLKDLLGFLNAERPALQLTALSMGTSSDYPVAIEEGATHIRLGEAILGPRPTRERQTV